MNQFNELHGDEPNKPQREIIIQPPEAHLKSYTLTPNTITEVLAIIEILYRHTDDNGSVMVYTSEYPF